MERAKQIRNLSEKLIPSKLNDQLEINLHYFEKTDEEEQPFSNLCAIIRQENIELSTEDKQLIDEIGESLWNNGKGEYRMITKYWKDLV